MATEQDWASYSGQAHLKTTDTLLVRTSAGAGVQVPGSALAARRSDGGSYTIPGEVAVEGTRLFAAVDGSNNFWLGALGIATEPNRLAYGFSVSGGAIIRQTWKVGGVDRVVLDSSTLMVGTSTVSGMYNGAATVPGVAFEMAGSILAQRSSGTCMWLSKATGYTDGGFAAFAVGGTQVGSITTNGSATAYNTSSDYRLKDDLKPLTGALDRILKLPVYDFRWKATGERAHGFLAHEYGEVIRGGATGTKDGMREEIVTVKPAVEPVFNEAGELVSPGVEAVTRTELVPEYQGVDQSKAVPYLVGAVQEMAAIIEGLRNRVATLEAGL